MMSIDGLPVNGQRTYTATPAACVCLNLPLHLLTKQENILLVSFIPGPASPSNPDIFIRPFLKEIVFFSRYGVRCYHSDADEWFTLQV